jgi:eukaryotic-like serine/threonine-protein kinase
VSSEAKSPGSKGAAPRKTPEMRHWTERDGLTPDSPAAAPSSATPRDGEQSSAKLVSSSPRSITRSIGSSGPSSGSFATSVEDRYEILGAIGAGGMGRVFKARDHKLARDVALKFLRDNEPRLIQRFFKEAQLQARIEHEHVCKIYEAGEIAGEPYIAMQLIEGVSLKRGREALTLEQKLDVMVKVADGLHAAHRIGLIHRDVKPSNLMLERRDNGAYHPYVMDFGLAREVSGANGQTLTESAVGTPAYMAPEQISGEAKKLDARTDVYGIGATFYELLTGRPPFIGESPVEILMQAAYEDPPLPRALNAAVPIDLQTIVMKCLEKDPARRYESARAFAEDIVRYRSHLEPIKARPASLARVLLKKARRHWAIVLLCGGLLVSGLVTLGVWIRGGILAQRREALAEELGKTVIKIELFLRYATALPAHDMTAERKVIQEQMRFLEATLARGDTNSAGPAHYALGRGHLAMKSYRAAKTNLELAIAEGYARPEVHYVLGLTLGKLYEQELDRAQRIADKDTREEAKKEAERSYRDPALLHLRQSTGTQVESKTYIDALVALYEKRYGEALAKAEEAIAEAPWLYEAKKIEGDARFALGMLATDAGRSDEARGELAKSISAYNRAANLARGDGILHEALAEVWIQVMDLDVRQGRLSKEPFEAALSACDQALMANPASANAYSKRGRAQFRWSECQLDHGEDPRSMLASAIESGKAALRLAPEDGVTWDMIGNSHSTIAFYQRGIGQDPFPALSEATKSFDEAIKHQPTLAWAWNDNGNVWLMRAEIEVARGIDPRATIEVASKSFAQAAAVDPAYLFPHTNGAMLMETGAAYELVFGRDPAGYAQRGIDSSSRAIRMKPQSGEGHARRAWALVYLAQYEFLSGRDPTSTLIQAEDDIRISLVDLSGLAFVHRCHGTIQHLRALNHIRSGTDASRALEDGRASLRRAVEIDPVASEFRVGLAQLEITAARDAAKKGKDPAPSLSNARAALEPMLQAKTRDADTFAAMAEIHALRAEYARRLRGNADEEIGAGLLAADNALQTFSDMPLALAAKGTLELLRARSRAGKAKMLTARIALSTLEQALAKNPLLPEKVKLLRDEAKKLADGEPGHSR